MLKSVCVPGGGGALRYGLTNMCRTTLGSGDVGGRVKLNRGAVTPLKHQ